MKPGVQLRFRGPAGAPFVVTVGTAFDERTINARVKSGEWTPLEALTPDGAPTLTPPPQSAAKDAWVAWAVSAQGLAETDAEAMTKKDLVALAGAE